MGFKYSKQLVLDYINGEDLPDGIEIDELENDSEFMKMVIDHTNDKKMYDFCGDEVKNDYLFVKYIIEKFKNDIDFIREVALEFLINNRDDIVGMSETEVLEKDFNCVEVSLLMSDILKKTGESNRNEFRAFAGSYYLKLRAIIEIEIEVDKQKGNKDNWGLGFLLIEDILKDREMILGYVAKRMVEDIFLNDKKYTFYQLVIRDAKKYENVGNVTDYLLRYIGKMDSNLAWYVTTHLNILDGLRSKLEMLLDEETWEYYFNDMIENNVAAFLQGVRSYYFDHGDNHLTINEPDLVEYVVRKLGIDKYFYEDDYKFQGEVTDDIKNGNISIKDLEAINFALKLGNSLFNDKQDDDELDSYIMSDVKENVDGEIVPFRRRN